jgi:ribosome-binding protein aMBF1 (putative translation factor)
LDLTAKRQQMPEATSAFADLLRRLRVRSGLSQSDLAEKANISEPLRRILVKSRLRHWAVAKTLTYKRLPIPPYDWSSKR